MNEHVINTNRLKLILGTAPLGLKKIVLLRKSQVCGDLSAELFWVEAEGRRYNASSFSVMNVAEHADARYKLLQFNLTHESGIAATLSFLADIDDSVEMILQMWSQTAKPALFVKVGLPFLSDGKMLGLADAAFHAPAAPYVSSRGEPILDLHPACLKVMSFVREDGYGVDVSFDTPKESNTQRGTPLLPLIDSLEKLQHFRASVRLNRYPAAVLQMKFEAVSDGWLETFDRIKRISRSKVDLDSYSRPDLKWYENTCLHHFTYLYSEEIFDYRQGKVDVDRLLEDGEAFGGYDVICLWHQYPRLGVDERSQWAFFEDFPGGLAGIASVTKACHQRGVKVMLPYKPWDTPEDFSSRDVAAKLGEIIARTDVDGFFLDTMETVPENFRLEADRVKSGCVFCTELFPENSKVLEVLTGSWQQSETLPYQLPILRYVFPEHHSHYISRWAMGRERDKMLQKAIINGSGVVIWQDIFGAWLPYEAYQKQEVRKWKAVWQENTAYFLSEQAIPLWPALLKDLIVCAYLHPDGNSAIFTMYNHSGCTLSGPLFSHRLGDVSRAEDLWGNTSASLRGGIVCGRLEPEQTAVIRVR